MANRISWVILPLLLMGCDRQAGTTAEVGAGAGNALEMAARERGIVHANMAMPTGVFERTHELGRDALCVVPDGASRWRFALTAAFGPGLSCAAHGTMVREGDGWRMRFAKTEGCEVLAREEEDELRLPGSLSPRCENLCPARASLAGLSLPRASWTEDDARRLQIGDGRGNIVRPCGD